jgi:hypothetical protein
MKIYLKYHLIFKDNTKNLLYETLKNGPKMHNNIVNYKYYIYTINNIQNKYK